LSTLQQQQYASDYANAAEEGGWTGWIGFAAIMMVLAGCFQGIAGFVALFKDEVFVVRDTGLIVSVDYTTWGWIHLGIAALLLLAGASLFAGNMYGRIVGVLVAMLSAVTNLVFIAAYPVWSVLIIAVDIFVIYAIVVHGRDLKTE
jgi:hypothetical protein